MRWWGVHIGGILYFLGVGYRFPLIAVNIIRFSTVLKLENGLSQWNHDAQLVSTDCLLIQQGLWNCWPPVTWPWTQWWIVWDALSWWMTRCLPEIRRWWKHGIGWGLGDIRRYSISHEAMPLWCWRLFCLEATPSVFSVEAFEQALQEDIALSAQPPILGNGSPITVM